MPPAIFPVNRIVVIDLASVVKRGQIPDRAAAPALPPNEVVLYKLCKGPFPAGSLWTYYKNDTQISGMKFTSAYVSIRISQKGSRCPT
jgi:hypothetical protein